MDRIIILDTNVLLADPNALLSFPRAEVVIPETVLSELDKLKTARVDPDLRFRGREVSRMLFELSEDGSLVEGVDLPDGGRVRVAPFEPDVDLPSGLSARNQDDRILATVYQVRQAQGDGADVTLVTNDLNMLLKAQTLGIPVERHGDGVEGGFSKRYIIRPFQRYRVPIAILAIAVAVFVGVLVLVIWGPGLRGGSTTIPPEFRSILSQQQQQALVYLSALQRNPSDQDALLGIANYYYDQNRRSQGNGDASAALVYGQDGLPYYERYLSIQPNDQNARSDYAALLFYTGQTDAAIQQVARVLQKDPNSVNGNFNLGVFYWQGNRQDLKAAANQFRKVIQLTQKDPQQTTVYQHALASLQAIQKQATSTGVDIGTTTSTVSP